VQEAVEAERGGGEPGDRLSLEKPVDNFGADVRLVAEDDHRSSDIDSEGGDTGFERSAHALRVVGLITTRARPRRTDRLISSA